MSAHVLSSLQFTNSPSSMKFRVVGVSLHSICIVLSLLTMISCLFRSPVKSIAGKIVCGRCFSRNTNHLVAVANQFASMRVNHKSSVALRMTLGDVQLGAGEYRAMSSSSAPQSPPSRDSSSSSASSTTTIVPDIVLTDQEKRLFKMFREVVKNNNLNTTVRVAGGWVRDRLLGLPSKNDIDIALDNITGHEFARHLERVAVQYKYGDRGSNGNSSGSGNVQQQGQQQQQQTGGGGERARISNLSIAVIKVNPDKSKHLETGRVCHCCVDVCDCTEI